MMAVATARLLPATTTAAVLFARYLRGRSYISRTAASNASAIEPVHHSYSTNSTKRQGR